MLENMLTGFFFPELNYLFCILKLISKLKIDKCPSTKSVERQQQSLQLNHDYLILNC